MSGLAGSHSPRVGPPRLPCMGGGRRRMMIEPQLRQRRTLNNGPCFCARQIAVLPQRSRLFLPRQRQRACPLEPGKRHRCGLSSLQDHLDDMSGSRFGRGSALPIAVSRFGNGRNAYSRAEFHCPQPPRHGCAGRSPSHSWASTPPGDACSPEKGRLIRSPAEASCPQAVMPAISV